MSWPGYGPRGDRRGIKPKRDAGWLNTRQGEKNTQRLSRKQNKDWAKARRYGTTRRWFDDGIECIEYEWNGRRFYWQSGID